MVAYFMKYVRCMKCIIKNRTKFHIPTTQLKYRTLQFFICHVSKILKFDPKKSFWQVCIFIHCWWECRNGIYLYNCFYKENLTISSKIALCISPWIACNYNPTQRYTGRNRKWCVHRVIHCILFIIAKGCKPPNVNQ